MSETQLSETELKAVEKVREKEAKAKAKAEAERLAQKAADGTVEKRLEGFTFTTRYVTREELSKGMLFEHSNWRTERDYQRLAPERAASLKELGQQTPLYVWERPTNPGVLEIIRGHTRVRGFLHLLETVGPEEFDRLFPKGIECRLYTKITERQVALLKQDNANSEDMRTKGPQGKLDWTRAGLTMIAGGCSRREITLALEPVTEALFPIRKDSRNGSKLVEVEKQLDEMAADLSELRAKIASTENEEAREAYGLTLSDKVKAQSALVEERNDLIEDIRRGMVDRLINHWNAGPYADHLLYFQAYGEKPIDCPKSLRLEGIGYQIRGGNVVALSKAARKDFGVSKGVLTPAQREEVPEKPHFQEAWKKVVADADKANANKKDKPTKYRMSGSKMTEFAAKLKSDGGRLICQVLAGEKEQENVQDDLDKFDSIHRIAELVHTHRKEFWDSTVVKMAAQIRDELREAAAAAVSQEAEETEEVSA